MQAKSRYILLLLILFICVSFSASFAAAAGGPSVVQVAGGLGSTYVLLSDRSLWACGKNSDDPYYGSYYLGDGTRTDRLTPVRIMQDVQTVCVPDYFALKTDGTLWGWGTNPFWYGAKTVAQPSLSPVQVMSDVKQAFPGISAMFVIKKDGSLWGWGCNQYGQLGLGDTKYRNTPTKIMDGGVVQVANGMDFTLFLKSDGSVWGCGYKRDGRLGLGQGDIHGSALTPVHIIDGVRKICAGYYSSMVIKRDNTLWGWGSNTGGAVVNSFLVDGKWITDVEAPMKLMENVRDVGGVGQTVVLSMEGNVYVWGLGRADLGDAALTIPAFTNAKAIGVGGIYAIDSGGRLYGWQYDQSAFGNESGTLSPYLGLGLLLGNGSSTEPLGVPILMTRFPNPSAPPIVVSTSTTSKRYAKYTEVSATIATTIDAISVQLQDSLKEIKGTLTKEYIDRNGKRYWQVSFQIAKKGSHVITARANSALGGASTISGVISVTR